MARLASNNLLRNIKGQLGKQLVFKKYGDKTVVTAYPDMSRVKPSQVQKIYRNKFKEAVAYVRKINRDPILKKQYAEKLKPGESVYHFALKEFLKK